MNAQHTPTAADTLAQRTTARLNESFLGWVADHATVDIHRAFVRYESIAKKHGDASWLAFPTFVDAVDALPYTQYDNESGDVHFLLGVKPSLSALTARVAELEECQRAASGTIEAYIAKHNAAAARAEQLENALRQIARAALGSGK